MWLKYHTILTLLLNFLTPTTKLLQLVRKKSLLNTNLVLICLLCRIVMGALFAVSCLIKNAFVRRAVRQGAEENRTSL